MVGASTKRKRKERQNRIAEQVEDSRAKAAAERRVLGVKVDEELPDIDLFQEDRHGDSRDVVKEKIRFQAAEQIRAAKRARRQAPKQRKSEAALLPNPNVKALGNPSRKKKKKGISPVEAKILRDKKFDKPVGHVGNRSVQIRKSKLHQDGKEDLWNSEISKQVEDEIGLNRRRIVEKTQNAQRSAAQVICPRDGLSMNPSYVDHQDKLGEALADIVKKDTDLQVAEEKMDYDPALLLESREGEVLDTGMKVALTDDEAESSEDDVPIFKPAPERKTRSQRNKESRKREIANNIIKKKRRENVEMSYKKIEAITEEAQEMAEKLNGDAKLKRLQEQPPAKAAVDEPILERISNQVVRNEATVEPIVLSTELSKSMRTVQMPVANPMVRDRFLSFERRGLIEPPKALPKEIWRMEQAREQALRRERRRRKGRGSRSKLTYWRRS